MKSAFYAIGGAVGVLVALSVFLRWMATGKLGNYLMSYRMPEVRWQDHPVVFVVWVVLYTNMFVVGCWLLVSTLLKWLSFDSRYS